MTKHTTKTSDSARRARSVRRAVPRRDAEGVKLYIDKMLELFHIYGWCQGQYRTSDGRLCLLGALEAAQESSGITNRLREITRHAIKEEIGAAYGTGGVAKWNDRKGRTLGSVERMLRRVQKAIA